MRISIKHLLIFLIYLTSNKSYSQIDTTLISSEINLLSNDSLVDDYWIKLNACDQDVKTFSQPILQTENLVKCIYFFKKFGFSNKNRFEKEKLSNSQAEMYAQFIWMHSGYMDLNIYTFPFIVECNKIYQEDYSYLSQNITVCRINQYPALIQKALSNAQLNSYENLDMNKIFELANELKAFKEEKLESKNIIGYWKIGKFDIQINKLDNGNYFFDCGGIIYKLIKVNDSVFNYATNIDDSYLEILENGNLVNKDKDGNILEIFEKKSL